MDSFNPLTANGTLWTDSAELTLTYSGDRSDFGVYAIVFTHPRWREIIGAFADEPGVCTAPPVSIAFFGDDSIPIYYGKGDFKKNNRPKLHLRKASNWRLREFISRHKAYIVYQWIIKNVTEVESFIEEARLIRDRDLIECGGTLLNYTYGGEGYVLGPEARTARSLSMRERYKNPAYRKKHAAALQKSRNLTWLENNIAAGRRRAADPEWQKKHNATLQKLHVNPEWQAKHAAALRRLHTDPSWLRKRKTAAQKLAADPAYIAKLSAGHKRRTEILARKARDFADLFEQGAGQHAYQA